jgi:hypothetical protein
MIIHQPTFSALFRAQSAFFSGYFFFAEQGGRLVSI